MTKCLNMTVNGVPYKEEGGKWVRDEEEYQRCLAREQEDQRRKDELIWALRSRVCTPEEMIEVNRRGVHLLLRFNGGITVPKGVFR